MDDLQSQRQTPLIDVLQDLALRSDAAFYTPGHKKGRGINPKLSNLLGKSVFRADLPELPELDNLFSPTGPIVQAQELAAAAFGACKTWFLVNGSTCGVIASILATCGAGEKIILPRNSHQSAIAGLIHTGAIPIWIAPEYDLNLDLAYGMTPAAVAKAIEQHPDVKAILMLYPTYQGACGDIRAIAQLAHAHNIPLLVDEAHGPHFCFSQDLPLSALAAGADLTVQSTHKVLGAMTQASMLHVQGDRLDKNKITKSLQLLQSTSPSYLLLASLDAARQQMAIEGEKLLDKTIKLARLAREELAQIPGLRILQPPQPKTPGFVDLDLTRLTVNIAQLGTDGFTVDEILHYGSGVTAELTLLENITFIISIGNTQTDIEKLIQAFKNLSLPADRPQIATLAPPTPPTHSPLTPREAFFAPKETVTREKAIERLSGELICPYPPGIPLLMPGEKIALETIEYLQQVLNLGGTITGCSDSSLNTLKVIKN
jgi:arginine/lysine/ornithine decarboxylase